MVHHLDVINHKPEDSCWVLNIFDEAEVTDKRQVGLNDLQFVSSWRWKKHLDVVFVHEFDELLVNILWHQIFAEVESHYILEVICQLENHGREVRDLIHVFGHLSLALKYLVNLSHGAVNQALSKDVKAEPFNLFIAQSTEINLLASLKLLWKHLTF